MIIKNKIIAKLISAILIATLALPSVAFASDENSNNNEFQNYNLNVQFHQTLARKHAEMLNEFRTSDTWYWNEDNTTKKQVSGLNELTYDYDLEQFAMQRAAEILFRYNHTRPDDTSYFSVYSDNLERTEDPNVYRIIDANKLLINGENIGIQVVFSGDVNEDLENNELWLFREEAIYDNYDTQGHRRNMLEPSHKVFAVAHASYGGLHAWVHLFGTHNEGSTYTEPLDSTKQMTVKVKKSLIFDASNIDLSRDDDEIRSELPEGVYLVSRYRPIYNSKNQLTDKEYFRFIGATAYKSNRVVIPNDTFKIQTEHYDIPVTITIDPRDTGDSITDEDKNNPDNYATYTVTPAFNQTNARNMLQSINEFRTSDTWWYNYENKKEDVSGLAALTYDYGLEQIAMQRVAELIFRKHQYHYRPDATSFKTAFSNFNGSVEENYAYFDYGVPNQDILEQLKETSYMGDKPRNRRNMLDPKWNYTGIAYARFNSHTYFVQVFSDTPLSQTQTAALNSQQQYNVKVYKPLISTANYAYDNGAVVIPDTNNNSSDDNNNNENENNDNSSNIKPYNIKVTYKQSDAREVADITNQFRTSDTWQYDENDNRIPVTGRQALIYDYGLEKIAMLRAAELACLTDNYIIYQGPFLAHTRLNNEMYDTAYNELYPEITYGICSENCACGFLKSDVVDGWKEEDCYYSAQGHRRNMLNPTYKYIGIACVVIKDRGWKGHEEVAWVQEFSDTPFDLTYTDPVNSEQEVTLKIDENAIANKRITLPGTYYDENEVINDPNDDNQLNPYDPASSISSNTIKSTYRIKTDISSLIPTPGAVKTKYKSSSKKIAKVNKKGIVTGGKKAGTATITKYVKYDKKSSWEEAGSITIQNYYPKLPKKQTLSIGSTLSMNSLLTGMDETPIKWESSKPSVATISENGMVVALQKGTAKLTPVFSSGKAKVKTTIKVK